MSSNPDVPRPAAGDGSVTPVSVGQDANPEDQAALVLPAFGRSTSTGSESSATATKSTGVHKYLVEPDSAAGDAVDEAMERMGLTNEIKSVSQKVIAVDTEVLECLLLPDGEGNKNPRAFTTMEDICQANLVKVGKDLVQKVESREKLHQSVGSGESNLQQLKKEEAELQRLLKVNKDQQKDTDIDLQADKDLHKTRVEECESLANSYAVTKWLQDHPEPLEHAEIPEVRKLIRFPTPNHAQHFKRRHRVSARKVLKRLGWEKSVHMRANFDGHMLVAPRREMDEKLLLGYLNFLPPLELSQVSNYARQASDQASGSLETIMEGLEEREDDTQEARLHKRKVKEGLEWLDNHEKKPRRS